MLSHERFLKDCTSLREQGGRLVGLTGRKLEEGEVELAYHFEVDGSLTEVAVRTERSAAPSLFSTFPNADFPERHAAQQYSIKFLGHPNLNLE